MNFTLPATAQGPSIEAEVNGVAIVYPLGPSLKLSWANCSMELVPIGTKLYRCELKPGVSIRIAALLACGQNYAKARFAA